MVMNVDEQSAGSIYMHMQFVLLAVTVLLAYSA